MNQAMNRPETPDWSALQKDTVLGGGWRVKERVTTRSAAATRSIVKPAEKRSGHHPIESDGASMDHQPSRLQSWSRHFAVIASSAAAIVALVTAADFLSSGLEPAGISHPANAETRISATADQNGLASPIDGYQLHLGAYQSELDARLVWAGLEAYPGTTLNGLHPLFQPRKSDDGDQVFHLLAGTFGGYDEADSRCAWLKEHNVDCSIVEG